MNVASYNFQSPYSSPVQVGRLDPSSVKQENESTKTQQSAKENQSKSQPLEENPAIGSQRLLDIYA
jgi:hypothetical protein